MAMVAYEHVLEMARQLKPEEQQALIKALQPQTALPINRELVLAEFARRKAAGLFENAESLYGKFAYPQVELTEEALLATIREFSTEWEDELDEFYSDNI